MPVTDDLLLRIAYLENNPEAIPRAADQLDRLTESERALNEESKNLSESTDKATDGFSKMQAGIVSLNAGIGVVREGIDLFQKAWDFSKEGAAIQRISQQFNNLATSVNTDAEHLLAGLNKAAHGTVDDEALMQTATRAMALGISSNSEDLIKLMEVARASSVAFGGDTAQAFERITTAVENLAPRSLKQSGIIINLDQAFKDYAASVGKSAESLTDEEKRQALLNQTLEKGADLVKRIGDQAEDSATKIARFETKATDLIDRLKEGAADAFIPTLDNLNFLETGFDANASQLDLMKAAYQSLVSQGFDPASEALLKLKARIDAEAAALQNALNMTDASDRATRRLTEAANAAQRAMISGKATDLSTMTPEKQMESAKAYKDYNSKLTDIEIKGAEERVKAVQDALDSIAKIEAAAGAKRAEIVSQFAADEASRLSDMRDKRIDILMSYSEAEQKITESQNKERLKLAESYGIETERAEQAHQLAMQRMSEDHGRNLRKLADSRDALGIEDEQENYRINRDRAEQDYQIQAAQRSEDYARQLADQNAAAEEQRQAARANQDKQLADLQETFTKQDKKYQDTYQKQLADLDKATSDQEKAVYDAQAKKLSDLQTAQDAERAQANDQWTQWRNEHEIFFAGEKALYDDYLKYTRDQLQAYINGGGATPTVSGGTTPTGIPGAGRASGGSVSPFGVYRVGENGPENLYMGRQGGYVAPNMGGSMFNVSINVAGTNATPDDIKSAVYAGITEVIQKAMRQ